MSNPLIQMINQAREQSGFAPVEESGFLPSRGLEDGPGAGGEFAMERPPTPPKVDFLDARSPETRGQEEMFDGREVGYFPPTAPPEPPMPTENIVFLQRNAAVWNGYFILMTADEVAAVEEVLREGAIRQIDSERRKLEGLFPKRKKGKKNPASKAL